jgi:hypothetical protein
MEVSNIIIINMQANSCMLQTCHARSSENNDYGLAIPHLQECQQK